MIRQLAILSPAWIFFFLAHASFGFTQDIEARTSELVEVYVWGQQPVSTATEQTIRQKDFELRPTTTPSDILRLVPGLFISQHQGGGKADQIFLRGFDADHGTDVAVFIDGIPVNFVSHGHGQGFADLHWLIPEIVDHVEVYKGPYFVQFGDFATAGAVNIVTKRRDKDTTLAVMGGSYNLQRSLGILSPPEGTPLTPYYRRRGLSRARPFQESRGFRPLQYFFEIYAALDCDFQSERAWDVFQKLVERLG